MAKCDNLKKKLLLTLEFLHRRTDEDHPATSADLFTYLENHGITCERKSLYTDLDALEDYGLDIIRTTGKTACFRLASRTFDLAELKLLADAVLSSKFLSQRKSMELLRKLETLTSEHNAGQLRRQLVVSGRVKTMNESVLYSVDALYQAIAQNSQIRFRYFEWDRNKERRDRGGERLASPYALCWDDANYYLIAHTPEHGLTHFRVDKMYHIELTGEPRTQTDETRGLKLSDYSTQVFGMFGGPVRHVRLRFENSLAGVVIDRFGKDVILIPDGPDHFLYTAQVRISPNFLSWVISFGRRAQILGPEDVVQSCRELCEQAMQACAAQTP